MRFNGMKLYHSCWFPSIASTAELEHHLKGSGNFYFRFQVKCSGNPGTPSPFSFTVEMNQLNWTWLRSHFWSGCDFRSTRIPPSQRRHQRQLLTPQVSSTPRRPAHPPPPSHPRRSIASNCHRNVATTYLNSSPIIAPKSTDLYSVCTWPIFTPTQD